MCKQKKAAHMSNFLQVTIHCWFFFCYTVVLKWWTLLEKYSVIYPYERSSTLAREIALLMRKEKIFHKVESMTIASGASGL